MSFRRTDKKIHSFLRTSDFLDIYSDIIKSRISCHKTSQRQTIAFCFLVCSIKGRGCCNEFQKTVPIELAKTDRIESILKPDSTYRIVLAKRNRE